MNGYNDALETIRVRLFGGKMEIACFAFVNIIHCMYCHAKVNEANSVFGNINGILICTSAILLYVASLNIGKSAIC